MLKGCSDPLPMNRAGRGMKQYLSQAAAVANHGDGAHHGNSGITGPGKHAGGPCRLRLGWSRCLQVRR